MAMYKVRITVYKGTTGKTLKGPTFVHFLGDICLGFGVIGVLLAILAVTDMEKHGAKVIIVGIVMAVVGFVLMAVLHKQARKSAEEAVLKALANQEGQTNLQKAKLKRAGHISKAAVRTAPPLLPVISASTPPRRGRR